MIKTLIYFLFLGGLFLVFSFDIGYKNPVDTINFTVIDKEITFEKDIKPIMNTYCGGVFCHHGKPSAWTKYKITKVAVDSGTFYDRVIDKRDMPKRKTIPEKEYQLIKKWLENGAVEK